MLLPCDIGILLKHGGGWGRCEGVQVLHCQMETVVSKLSMIPNLLIMRLAYG